MGRELKRVSLDFNWPIGKVWGGYLNPFYKQCIVCPTCEGSGASPEYKAAQDRWYGNAPFKPEDRGSVPFLPTHPIILERASRNCDGSRWSVASEAVRLCELFNKAWNHHLNQEDVDALIKANRIMDFTHEWKSGDGWKKKNPPYHPIAKEVNEWSIQGMGHDSINCWIVVEAYCKRLKQYTTCPSCKGKASIWPSKKIELQAARWRKTEPPKGEGYQIWETVSEGSSVSPVFVSPEDLACWMCENDTSVTKGTTFEQWMKFINGPGWAPSMIGSSSGIVCGVQAIS